MMMHHVVHAGARSRIRRDRAGFGCKFAFEEGLGRHREISGGMKVGENGTVFAQHGCMTEHPHVGFERNGLAGRIGHFESERGILPDPQRLLAFPQDLGPVRHVVKGAGGIGPGNCVCGIAGPRIIWVTFR